MGLCEHRVVCIFDVCFGSNMLVSIKPEFEE